MLQPSCSKVHTLAATLRAHKPCDCSGPRLLRWSAWEGSKSSMSFHARVLWTKHLTKKRKTMHDGSVTVEPCGHASLQDEGNSTLATAKLAPSTRWEEDAERACCSRCCRPCT